MNKQYRVTKTIRNAWGEVVFAEGQIVEGIEISRMDFYRPVGSDETPRFISAAHLVELDTEGGKQ